MTGLNLFQAERVGQSLVVAVHDGVGSFADAEILGEMQGVVWQLDPAGVRSVVIDFEGVNYFGSSMLEALRLLWNELEKRDGRLALCNLSSVSREIVAISHFDQLWPIYGSRDEALHALNS